MDDFRRWTDEAILGVMVASAAGYATIGGLALLLDGAWQASLVCGVAAFGTAGIAWLRGWALRRLDAWFAAKIGGRG